MNLHITEFLGMRIAEDEIAALRGDSRDRDYAEAAAKRELLEMHRPGIARGHYDFECCCGFENHFRAECEGCGATTFDAGDFERPVPGCPTLKRLAGIYSAHPDYRPEWANRS